MGSQMFGVNKPALKRYGHARSFIQGPRDLWRTKEAPANNGGQRLNIYIRANIETLLRTARAGKAGLGIRVNRVAQLMPSSDPKRT